MNRRFVLLGIAVLALTACASSSERPADVGSTNAARNFVVMIEGRNFLFDHEGRPTRFGFSTTRNISAQNASEAERVAIRNVREDETLSEHLLNPAEDPPRVTVTHATEVDAFTAPAHQDPGYIFYRDRDSK